MARIFAWIALRLTIAAAVEDAAKATAVAPNPFDAPKTHEVAHRHRKHTHAESATCYGRRYPDLAYHFCKDETQCNVRALHDHFRDHGRREGRRFGCEAAPLTAAEAARWEAQAARARARAGRVEKEAAPAATPAPEPPPGPLGLADRLGKLAALHERGALTDAEFAKAKALQLGTAVDVPAASAAATARADDCHKRPGLPSGFASLYGHLDAGGYSQALYGAPHKMPRCSQLRLIWLPLIDNATLNSIFLCRSDHTGVHLPVPERLLVMARGYQYKDAAFVSTVGRGGNIDIRGTFAPPGIQSDSWIEVTHCPVGGERENLWFYRMPGSGLSIFTGVAQTFSTRGPRTGKDHLSPNLDTAHWTSAPGPGQELVRLNTGKLGGLGVRGKRISGADLVAMGHMKCGQPPDVRDCRPDDVAARLHTECAGWNEKDPLKRFTDEHRAPVLNEVVDKGVHICTKKGSDEIIRAATRRRRLLGLVH